MNIYVVASHTETGTQQAKQPLNTSGSTFVVNERKGGCLENVVGRTGRQNKKGSQIVWNYLLTCDISNDSTTKIAKRSVLDVSSRDCL